MLIWYTLARERRKAAYKWTVSACWFDVKAFTGEACTWLSWNWFHWSVPCEWMSRIDVPLRSWFFETYHLLSNWTDLWFLIHSASGPISFVRFIGNPVPLIPRRRETLKSVPDEMERGTNFRYTWWCPSRNLPLHSRFDTRIGRSFVNVTQERCNEISWEIWMKRSQIGAQFAQRRNLLIITSAHERPVWRWEGK